MARQMAVERSSARAVRGVCIGVLLGLAVWSAGIWLLFF